MTIVAINPAKNLRKINSLGFTILLLLVCSYQASVTVENTYRHNTTTTLDLTHQHHELTQEIGKDIALSLSAPNQFSRLFYLNHARENINFLRLNYTVLLNINKKIPIWLPQNTQTLALYKKAQPYLIQMNDIILKAVAESEQEQFSLAAQIALKQALYFYLENENNFIGLITQGTDVYNKAVQDYLRNISFISWLLMGLIVLIALLNRHFVENKTVKSVDLQFKELHKKLEFQHALLNSAHEAIVSIATNGRIIIFSPSASALFGYSAEEAIGQNINILMPENFRTQHDAYLKNYLSTGIAKVINTKRCVTVQGRRKNGSLFPLSLKLIELKTSHQHNFIGFIQDLTEEKAVELKLLQAKNEAEAANKAKSLFLSSVSHELKTPLNAILGFSQLLETDNNYPLTQAQTEWVKHIYRAGKLLMALISDILDLSKIEVENIKLSVQEFSVNEVILEALNLIENIATQNNIRIKTRIDPLATLYIKADPLRFKQILINLLSNAIKYNEENGLIVISSKVVNGQVKVSVKDSGKGIDESKLMELFKPFNRLGVEKSKIEGTGIGLCIAKKLVERMGGEIGVRSNEKSGCCFWVEFPLFKQEKLMEDITDDLAHNLQSELAYLQDSLNHIGLIKNSALDAV